MEDSKIIDLYWQRSEEAIRQTRDAYGAALLHLALGVLGDARDAEEVVSDTYAGAWQTIPPERPRKLFAFLAAICRHQAYHRLDWNLAAKRNAQVISLSQELATSGMGCGYCFADGTFNAEGHFTLLAYPEHSVDYQMRSVQKTSFDAVLSSVWEPEFYEQWLYTTSDGLEVFLAVSRRQEDDAVHGYIFVDREDCFIKVSVYTDIGQIRDERAFLEAACEAFLLDLQVQPVSPEEADALEALANEKYDSIFHPQPTTGTDAP